MRAGPIQKRLKVSNRQILKTLKRMKDRMSSLQRDEEGYLCHLFQDEVEMVVPRKWGTHDAILLSEEVIQSRLVMPDGGVGYTYNDWVLSWHPKVHARMVTIESRYPNRRNPFQVGRGLWLDSLIEEYGGRR